MRKLLTMVLIPLLMASGCATKFHAVDEQYRPLERIGQSFLRPGSGITTLGRTCYVRDLDDWLAAHPPGGARYHAIMLHEREHSVRQLDMGLNKWLGKYLTELDFMWAEEQRGWFIQIREYQRRGLRPNPEGIAKILAGYKAFSGSMVSYEDALKWVQDVLAGRWSPPQE